MLHDFCAAIYHTSYFIRPLLPSFVILRKQVPQFVLEEAELQGSGAEVHIVVTQPRRIAAIRLPSLDSYFGAINFGYGLT